MAGENRKVDYVTGVDGVRYKLVVAPVDEKPNVERSRKKSTTKRRTLLIVLPLLLLLVCGFGIAVYMYKQSLKSPIDAYSKSFPFQLYYPMPLPEGYGLKKNSPTKTGDILLFALTNKNTEFAISEQPLPAEFSSFRIDGFSPVSTPIGSMLVGSTQGAPTGLISTGETLITIKGPDDSKQDAIIKIGQSMRKIHKTPKK